VPREGREYEEKDEERKRGMRERERERRERETRTRAGERHADTQNEAAKNVSSVVFQRA
jgi:hypothetical protein